MSALGSTPRAPPGSSGTGGRRASLRHRPRLRLASSAPMQGRRTILMVQDEESITVPLAEALAREGFDTEVAGTAAEALELAGSIAPDLVLLDVMLPDGSGYDVCREL